VEEALMAFARVATFEGGDTERLRQMNEERQQSGAAMPDGVRRAMLLVDEEGGRRLFVTFFDSREDVERAEERFEAMGDEIPEDVRGRRLSLDVYEVVLDQST
jgi:hypothetical protein